MTEVELHDSVEFAAGPRAAVDEESAQIKPVAGKEEIVSETFPAKPLMETTLTTVEFEKPTGNCIETRFIATAKSSIWNETAVE